MNIPEIINNFNMYKNGTALIGITGDVKLPDFTQKTETISGPGILGEFETGVAGNYGSMDMEIPFRTINNDMFKFIDPTQIQDITLRGSVQSTDSTTSAAVMTGMRVVVRGKVKEFKAGTAKVGGQMGSSINLEILYILIEFDGKSKLELDKLNSVFKVDGVDLLQKVRSQC